MTLGESRQGVNRRRGGFIFLSLIALLLFIGLPSSSYSQEVAAQTTVPNPPNSCFCRREQISNVVCDLILFLDRKKIHVQALAKTKTAAQFGYDNVLDERWVRTDQGIFEIVVYKKNRETEGVIRSLREDADFNKKIYWKTLPATASIRVYINAWKDAKPLFDSLDAFRWKKNRIETTACP